MNRNPTVVHLWMEQLSRKNKRLKERTLQVTSVRKLASFARTNGATSDARLVLFLFSFTSFQTGRIWLIDRFTRNIFPSNASFPFQLDFVN